MLSKDPRRALVCPGMRMPGSGLPRWAGKGKWPGEANVKEEGGGRVVVFDVGAVGVLCPWREPSPRFILAEGWDVIPPEEGA